MKLDSQGNLLWTRTYGGFAGGRDEAGNAIALDSQGNVFVGGYANEYTQGPAYRYGNAYVEKYNPNGVLLGRVGPSGGIFSEVTDLAIGGWFCLCDRQRLQRRPERHLRGQDHTASPGLSALLLAMAGAERCCAAVGA